MHVQAIAGYFGLLLAWRLLTVWTVSHDVRETAASTVPLLLVAATAFALIALVSRLIAKTTVYSITSKRIVMRYGIALPVTVNVPYNVIGSADLKSYPDGSGDIAFAVQGPNPLGYYHLWPHARGWRVARPQPSFRSLEEAAEVANVLAKALHAATGLAAPAPVKSIHRPAKAAYAPSHAEPAAA
jgi:hypothetical protein